MLSNKSFLETFDDALITLFDFSLLMNNILLRQSLVQIVMQQQKHCYWGGVASFLTILLHKFNTRMRYNLSYKGCLKQIAIWGEII